MHLALGAMLVVAAQVAGVGDRLIEVGLLRLGLALELEYDDAPLTSKMTSGRRDSSGSSYSRMAV